MQDIADVMSLSPRTVGTHLYNIKQKLGASNSAELAIIAIRAGLHTGEVELQDGQVAGIAVHIAARVMALAGAGEVLVSGTVKDLVVGSGIRFDDRGSHALKGVPDEWRLFEVAGLP